MSQRFIELSGDGESRTIIRTEAINTVTIRKGTVKIYMGSQQIELSHDKTQDAADQYDQILTLLKDE